jgi:hypothetical protein
MLPNTRDNLKKTGLCYLTLTEEFMKSLLSKTQAPRKWLLPQIFTRTLKNMRNLLLTVAIVLFVVPESANGGPCTKYYGKCALPLGMAVAVLGGTVAACASTGPVTLACVSGAKLLLANGTPMRWCGAIIAGEAAGALYAAAETVSFCFEQSQRCADSMAVTHSHTVSPAGTSDVTCNRLTGTVRACNGRDNIGEDDIQRACHRMYGQHGTSGPTCEGLSGAALYLCKRQAAKCAGECADKTIALQPCTEIKDLPLDPRNMKSGQESCPQDGPTKDAGNGFGVEGDLNGPPDL